MSEALKKINELAYLAGRHYQSQETGFLHLCYQLAEDQIAHSIPIVENVLFALALLRLKTQDSVLEAKDLLEKLLYFQADSGNFPVYIHEYPQCRSYFIGADLLLAFHWIIRLFGHVLGDSLKKRLGFASEKLLKFNLEMLRSSNTCPVVQVKLAAASSKSLNIDKELFWYIPEQIGEVLVAAQLLDSSSKEKVFETWHPELGCYTGPAIKEYHLKSHKELTLLDLYMAALTNQFPEGNIYPHYMHLKGALIQTEEYFQKLIFPKFYEGNIENTSYGMLQEKNFAYSFIGVNKKLLSKGFHPFYFTWGKNKEQRTCVMQGGNIEAISFEQHENAIVLYIDLSAKFNVDEREESKEICFYTEVNPNTSIVVNNSSATTFLLDQTVTVQNPSMKIKVVFSLEKGEGFFRGHIMRANRPSQKYNSIKDRFAAFDWQISLRTLKRSSPCQVKVQITYEEI